MNGSIKNAKTKIITLWISPFYNHYYGITVYESEPKINAFGLDENSEYGHETTPDFLETLGLKYDFKNMDYEYFEKRFNKEGNEWHGGLMAKTFKVVVELPIYPNGKIVLF